MDELRKKGRRAAETVVADTLARWGWGAVRAEELNPGGEGSGRARSGLTDVGSCL